MNIDKDQLDVADWWKVQGLEHVGTMLSCVCDAIGNAQAEQNKVLERIATALERAHPKQLDAGDVRLLEPGEVTLDNQDQEEA